MASATTITAPKINLKLTSNDAAVLQALFDNSGEPSFSAATASSSSTTNPSSDRAAADPSAVTIDESLQPFPRFYTEKTALKSLKDRELAIVNRIQQQESTNTENRATSSVLKQAVNDLSSLIEEQPDYPPLYANRAQALRMLIQSSSTTNSENSDKDAAIFDPQNTELATRLLSDLSKAILLASPNPSNRNGTRVSPAQHRLLSNVYTHRGYILLKAGKIRKEEEEEEKTETVAAGGGPKQLLDITSRDQLEEMASRDFFEASWYGNEVAKQLSVQTNPYAKMCGAIVKEALKKEIEEFQSY